MADLCRKLDLQVKLEFITLSSYIGDSKTSTGKVEIISDVRSSLKDKNVLIVEDIVDTGKTLNFLHNHFAAFEPKCLKIAVLLDKPSRREIDNIKGDYTGFEIPDHFVLGYGLDVDQEYRNLPFVGYVAE